MGQPEVGIKNTNSLENRVQGVRGGRSEQERVHKDAFLLGVVPSSSRVVRPETRRNDVWSRSVYEKVQKRRPGPSPWVGGHFGCWGRVP